MAMSQILSLSAEKGLAMYTRDYISCVGIWR